jgi:hypothetical protein
MPRCKARKSRGKEAYYRSMLIDEACSATPAFAGVNSADACPAYAGGIFKQSVRLSTSL